VGIGVLQPTNLKEIWKYKTESAQMALHMYLRD
jgi:hypothetical protein